MKLRAEPQSFHGSSPVAFVFVQSITIIHNHGQPSIWDTLARLPTFSIGQIDILTSPYLDQALLNNQVFSVTSYQLETHVPLSYAGSIPLILPKWAPELRQEIRKSELLGLLAATLISRSPCLLIIISLLLLVSKIAWAARKIDRIKFANAPFHSRMKGVRTGLFAVLLLCLLSCALLLPWDPIQQPELMPILMLHLILIKRTLPPVRIGCWPKQKDMELDYGWTSFISFAYDWRSTWRA